ncbi:hypothetical protein RSOLAG22IIIB_10019 [Rhizoctonia solani]|uniref:Uncharacterized protein n=1 Tax=Rhizoctonia solani TaxID=456999 RepID=A0A0K6G110_9AGAM|nr:hypothetical protein RSOLAG22IIIB_10019 [Rhizoctonia solani]
MSLEHLIIKQATDAQAQEALLHEAGLWGARFEIDINDYVKLAPIFEHGAFARDGRLTLWVLIPEDDPDSVKIYASCQVFIKVLLAAYILTLQPGETSPSASFGHLITSVVVAPEHRGKGYGKRFMSLMHSALAAHRYPKSKCRWRLLFSLCSINRRARMDPAEIVCNYLAVVARPDTLRNL